MRREILCWRPRFRAQTVSGSGASDTPVTVRRLSPCRRPEPRQLSTASNPTPQVRADQRQQQDRKADRRDGGADGETHSVVTELDSAGAGRQEYGAQRMIGIDDGGRFAVDPHRPAGLDGVGQDEITGTVRLHLDRDPVPGFGTHHNGRRQAGGFGSRAAQNDGVPRRTGSANAVSRLSGSSMTVPVRAHPDPGLRGQSLT